MTFIFHGDCKEQLKNIKDETVDAIITDPPYGISFMNNKWDYDVPNIDIWRECLRVLKKGCFLLSFASARTYHRMACNIEDSGFEIRDQLMWIYSSGFPKHKSQLKPCHEPIVMAKKRGATKDLRIDDCRVGTDGGCKLQTKGVHGKSGQTGGWGTLNGVRSEKVNNLGRYPGNIIHDGNLGYEQFNNFFYCAKPTDKEIYNIHPTVKPTKLIEYLIRISCFEGSLILDPFMGSGTTGKAALQQGMEFIGIEQNKEYVEIAKKRLDKVVYQRGLF